MIKMTKLTLLDKILYAIGIKTKNRERYEEEQLAAANKEAARRAKEIRQIQEEKTRNKLREHLNDPTVSKEEILNEAIRTGNMLTIEECIKAGADLNKSAPTLPLAEALIYYIHSNLTEGRSVISMLLANGADIQAIGVDGKPVIYRIQNNYTIDLMIQYKGAEAVRTALNMRDKTNKTVGMNMVLAKRDVRVIEQMVDAGLDLSVTDNDGKTIKDYLIDHQRNHLSPDYAALLDKVERLEEKNLVSQ